MFLRATSHCPLSPCSQIGAAEVIFCRVWKRLGRVGGKWRERELGETWLAIPSQHVRRWVLYHQDYTSPTRLMKEAPNNGETPKRPETILEIPARRQDPESSLSIYTAVYIHTRWHYTTTKTRIDLGGTARLQQDYKGSPCHCIYLSTFKCFGFHLTLRRGFTILAIPPDRNGFHPKYLHDTLIFSVRLSPNAQCKIPPPHLHILPIPAFSP